MTHNEQYCRWWGIRIPSAYPNPVQIELNTTIGKSITVNVLDLPGRHLIKNSKPIITGKNKISLNIASLAPGIYFIEVKQGNTPLEKYKVLKLLDLIDSK